MALALHFVAYCYTTSHVQACVQKLLLVNIRVCNERRKSLAKTLYE